MAKWICISLLALLISGEVSAGLVTRDYVFADPALSGGFAYDDTTAVALGGSLTGFTAYTGSSLSVTYSSGAINETWGLGDLIPFSSPGYSWLPTVDPSGAWLTALINPTINSWVGVTFQNSSGAQLSFNATLTSNSSSNIWSDPAVVANGVRSSYGTMSATVPEPGTLSLLGAGLLGLASIRKKVA